MSLIKLICFTYYKFHIAKKITESDTELRRVFNKNMYVYIFSYHHDVGLFIRAQGSEQAFSLGVIGISEFLLLCVCQRKVVKTKKSYMIFHIKLELRVKKARNNYS